MKLLPTLAVFVVLASLAVAWTVQGGGAPPPPVGGGNITACGPAPGGDPSVEISKGRSNPGNITVTGVSVAGVMIDSSKYTVTDNSGSSPEITFHVPDPGAPGKGEEVCVYGTTSKGDQEMEGVLDW